MNKIDILKRIVAEDGSCTWSCESICQQCPLSKVRLKDDGNYYSCIEALGVQDLTEEEADKKYKEVAERLLLDETIEAILGEDSNGAE